MTNDRQKRTQKTLEAKGGATQALLKAIVDTAVDGIIVIDDRGIVASMNPAAEKLFGYSTSEVVGKNISMLMPSPFQEQHDAYMQSYIRTGVHKIIGIGREVVGLRKNGSQFPVFLSVGELHVENRRMFTGIIRDITTLKAAEESLRETNKELSERIWLSEGLARLFEELRGELTMEELCSRTIGFLCRYLSGIIGSIYVNDGKVLRRSGSYAFALSGAKEYFSFGEGLIGQAAAEKKFAKINAVPESYVKVQSSFGETKPNCLLIFPICIDNKVEAVIEIGTLGQFADQPFLFLTHVSDSIGIAIKVVRARRVQELLEQTQKQAQMLQVQQEELRVTNEELEQRNKILINAEARLQAQQEELRQLNEELEEQTRGLEERTQTQQKANEELQLSKQILLENQQQLELAGKYKSEFLANMSHELRTPLNSLLILSRLLFENKEGRLSAEQIDFAKTINASGADLLNLINDILDLSKIEAGKTEITAEEIDVRETLRALLKSFEVLAREKSLQLITEFAEDVPVSLQTDGRRLGQIVKNLVSNAVKFTLSGSVKIQVFVPRSENFPGLPIISDDMFAIAVRDTGIGIAANQQEIIFEPFLQADGTTSRKFGGTGLGLTISRKLAGLLGGFIYLESAMNHGSTFTVILPRKLPEGGPAKVKNAPVTVPGRTFAAGGKPLTHSFADKKHPRLDDDIDRIAAGDKKLLIIEDDDRFAQILIKFGRERGFKCLAAESGEIGLELVKSIHPDGIILDIKLPGMSGLEVLERLKGNPKTRHIPVHIASIDDEKHSSLYQGAVGFLPKPATEENILIAIQKLQDVAQARVKQLLIVEDDPTQRMSLQKLIGNGDVKTTCAESAEEALNLLGQNQYDCIVLDLGLPDASGFHLLENLSTDGGFAPPPVIIYTGREISLEEEARLRTYSDSIIIKGAHSPERLLEEITLFLHKVEEKLPQEKRQLLLQLRDELFHGKTVLIVDDDMRNVFALSSVMKERGLGVEVARNGKEALRQLAENDAIDLVLMDIMMPEMDGYEAMREIRANSTYGRVPIIALTAKAMVEDRQKCLNAGANDYIPKPIDLDQLLTLMRVWLSKKG